MSLSTSFVGIVLVFGWLLLFNVPSLEFLAWLLVTIGYILLALQLFSSSSPSSSSFSLNSKHTAAMVSIFIEVVALIVVLTTVNWSDSASLRAIDFENPDTATNKQKQVAEERRDLNRNKFLSVAVACLAILCFCCVQPLPTWLPAALGPYINMDITPSLSFFLFFFGILAVISCYKLELGLSVYAYQTMWKGDLHSVNSALVGMLSIAAAVALLRDVAFFRYLPFSFRPVLTAFVWDMCVDVLAVISFVLYIVVCASFARQDTPVSMWFVTYLASLTALFVLIYGQQQYMTTAVSYTLEYGMPAALLGMSLWSLSNANRVAGMFGKMLSS